MESENSGILHAITIEESGRGEVLTGDEISRAVHDARLAWVSLQGDDPQAREWIEREISYLDDLIIGALLADETRPRVLEYRDGVLLILRGVNLNESADPDDMVSIRLWVDPHRIISVQRRPLKAVRDIMAKVEAGEGPRGVGEFVAMLTEHLLKRMEPTLQGLDENLDDLEERVMENPERRDRQQIAEIRKQAISLRRYIAPQRDAIANLRVSSVAWLSSIDRRGLQEALDRTTRYVEDLDSIRERSAVVMEELSSNLADRMNKNTYVLSVIASIFLPLGFLTGLLGINVGGIPGADNANSFAIFSAILIIIVFFQIILFKKMKWF